MSSCKPSKHATRNKKEAAGGGGKRMGKWQGAALKLRDALRCHMIFNRVTNEYIVRSDQSRAKPDPFSLHPIATEQRPLTTRAQTAETLLHKLNRRRWQPAWRILDVVLCPFCPTSLALLLFDVLSLIGTLDDAGVGWLLMLPLLWLVRVRVAALIHAVPQPSLPFPFLYPLPNITLYNSLAHKHTNLCI